MVKLRRSRCGRAAVLAASGAGTQKRHEAEATPRGGMDGVGTEMATPSPNDDEASPRTSLSSNASNFILQSPDVVAANNALPQTRHSIDDIHELSRQALTRRLSTLSAASSFGDIGEGNLSWNPRETGINGLSRQCCSP